MPLLEALAQTRTTWVAFGLICGALVQGGGPGKRFLLVCERLALGAVIALSGSSFVFAQTFSGAGLGGIPDNNPAGLDTTFTVSGVTGPITDLTVSATLTHTWVGDLIVTLIAPGGSPSATIFARPNRVGGAGIGSGSHLGGTYGFVDPLTPSSLDFWPAAATSPVAPGLLYRTSSEGAGTGTPLVSPFAGLTPAQINGAWTLRFVDAAAADTGTVTATSLTLTAVPPAIPMTSTPSSGVAVALPAQTLGGAATTAIINFQNANASAGTVTCVAPAATEFTVAPIPLSVPATGNADLTVSFNSAVAGPLNGTLDCTGSNGEAFTYPLSGSAVALPPMTSSRPVPAMGSGALLLLILSLMAFGMLLVRHRKV